MIAQACAGMSVPPQDRFETGVWLDRVAMLVRTHIQEHQ